MVPRSIPSSSSPRITRREDAGSRERQKDQADLRLDTKKRWLLQSPYQKLNSKAAVGSPGREGIALLPLKMRERPRHKYTCQGQNHKQTLSKADVLWYGHAPLLQRGLHPHKAILKTEWMDDGSIPRAVQKEVLISPCLLICFLTSRQLALVAGGEFPASCTEQALPLWLRHLYPATLSTE